MVAEDAADTVFGTWESFVSFYDYPGGRSVPGAGVDREKTALPWVGVQAVRLRRTPLTGMKLGRDSALYLVFKVSLRLSERWRPLNGDRCLMGLLIDGAAFEDGILTELPVSIEEAARRLMS